MITKRRRTAGLLALAWSSATGVAAQQPPMPIPVLSEKLESVKVGETRPFWVSLPDAYSATGEPYPVLYMMDGELNFNSGAIGGLRYAASLGEIPEFIIVGIENTDRSQDIFPEEVTYADGSKAGGRADRYLDFVQSELIPYIDRTYRTQPYRVLYGTSNTGFTAVHALFHRPELASAFIAASATLSVPGFLAERDERIRTFAGGKRQLVLVMGEQDLPTVLVQNSALKEKDRGARSGESDLPAHGDRARGARPGSGPADRRPPPVRGMVAGPAAPRVELSGDPRSGEAWSPGSGSAQE